MLEDVLSLTSAVRVGSLGTINPDGSPWSTPLHMAVDDTRVVWLSDRTAQHSQNIARDPRVSLTLWTGDTFENVKGVYLQSEAREVTGLEEVVARQLYMARFPDVPEKLAGTSTYVASLAEINTTKSRGGRVYFGS